MLFQTIREERLPVYGIPASTLMNPLQLRPLLTLRYSHIQTRYYRLVGMVLVDSRTLTPNPPPPTPPPQQTRALLQVQVVASGDAQIGRNSEIPLCVEGP